MQSDPRMCVSAPKEFRNVLVEDSKVPNDLRYSSEARRTESGASPILRNLENAVYSCNVECSLLTIVRTVGRTIRTLERIVLLRRRALVRIVGRTIRKLERRTVLFRRR